MRVAPILPTVFRIASGLRGARVFHPRGAVFEATWIPVHEIAALRDTPLGQRPRPALLRLSHGIGLPAGAPDILGLAVKIPDAHGEDRDQDFLFATSARGVVGRHLVIARRWLTGGVFSTVLPYDVAGFGRAAIVARAPIGVPATTYAEALEPTGSRVPTFEIRLGNANGPSIAIVVAGHRIPHRIGEGLRFDPWHTGAEFTPIGWLNRVRRPTYAASQDGRGAPREASPGAAAYAVAGDDQWGLDAGGDA